MEWKSIDAEGGSVIGKSSTGLDSRYNFTNQFLAGAASQSLLAFDLESRLTWPPDKPDEVAHRGFVVGAVLQSVAALESELWSLVHHGPGYYRGSDGTDIAARDFLSPLADMLDSGDIMSRYSAVLHLLSKPPLDLSRNPCQDMRLLVRLRNEVVHYKSKYSSEFERTKTVASLKAQDIPIPTYMPENVSGWFPHACLSAPRAAWAVETAVAFLDEVYLLLGVESPLVKWRDHFVARPEVASI